MKVTREQAEKNRERVVTVAGELFRERGFNGVGIAELMQAADLTHGGFYGNFASKEDLAAEASAGAMAATGASLDALTSAASDPFAALVGFYLSPEHRDAVGSGCAVAALAGDASRWSAELRDDGTSVLRLRVAAVPDKGRANAAAIALLAKALGVPKSALTLLAGETARLKTIAIAGDGAELAARLEALVA